MQKSIYIFFASYFLAAFPNFYIFFLQIRLNQRLLRLSLKIIILSKTFTSRLRWSSESNSRRRILFVIFRIVYIFPHHLMEWGWCSASCLSRKEVLDNRSGSSYYHGNKVFHREKAPAPPDSAEPGLWPIRWPISENQRVDTVDKAVICTHRNRGQKCRKAPNSRALTSRRIFTRRRSLVRVQ